MIDEPKASGALDAELLAAYLDKRLPPAARAAVEAKLAADPDSYELLVELIHANEALKDQLPQGEEQPTPEERKDPQAGVVRLVPRAPKVGRWAIAGGVLAVAAALVLAVRLQPELLRRFEAGSNEPRLVALVAAAGDLRVTEGRLTGGFRHAPAPAVTRGAGAESTLNVGLLKAAGDVQAAARSEATAANLHAEGVAQLLIGNRDGAIQALENAAGLAAERGAIWSDLAAAYLARGDADGNAADYSRAHFAVTRALATQNPPSPETLFNRALAAEKLNQAADARRFWQDALTAESDPAWQAEIAERVRRAAAR